MDKVFDELELIHDWIEHYHNVKYMEYMEEEARESANELWDAYYHDDSDGFDDVWEFEEFDECMM